MSAEAPVNKGHRFANMAEDYEDNEEWLKAAETHSKAAEQFEIAIKDATDQEAIRTLRLLSSNHLRKANELNRKAQRILSANTANQQRNDKMIMNTVNASTSNGINNVGLLNALNNRQPKRNNNLLVSRLAGIQEDDKIGESYALLSNDDQEDDPFNKFLEAVEGLVQQLFNPAVAFTSVPLNENDNPVLPSTEQDDTTIKKELLPMLDSYYMVPNPDGTDTVNHVQTKLPIDDRITTESKGDQVENDHLRGQIIQLKKKLKSLQMCAEENNMLKSSVLQFRNDVHKQAKRIMQSHHETSLRSSSLLGPTSSLRYLPLQHTNRPDMITRLKELEEENKQLKIQNEKQKILMNRYKERWEMLKENAKKRRASTAI